VLYFIRHGESQANLDRVFAGIHRRAPLTPLGQEQARVAGRAVLEANMKIDQIVSSPLERARETAEIVAGCLGMDPGAIAFDARLSEYDVGDLAGKPTEGVSSEQLVGAVGAEDPAAFQARVVEALGDAVRREGNILLVSHGGVGQVIEATRRGIDPAGFYELPRYLNGQVVELTDFSV
jgi:2,3-bisphosphoglycerate-dependent phosphoglycerate mutase